MTIKVDFPAATGAENQPTPRNATSLKFVGFIFAELA